MQYAHFCNLHKFFNKMYALEIRYGPKDYERDMDDQSLFLPSSTDQIENFEGLSYATLASCVVYICTVTLPS